MSGKALILVSCGSEDEARRIARQLVEERLAAGVQIVPISSTYSWKGAIVDDAEWLLVVKTRGDLYARVEEAVLGVHSYEVPQVIMLEVSQGHSAYLDWIDGSTID